jgi:hypothetical protein
MAVRGVLVVLGLVICVLGLTPALPADAQCQQSSASGQPDGSSCSSSDTTPAQSATPQSSDPQPDTSNPLAERLDSKAFVLVLGGVLLWAIGSVAYGAMEDPRKKRRRSKR